MNSFILIFLRLFVLPLNMTGGFINLSFSLSFTWCLINPFIFIFIFFWFIFWIVECFWWCFLSGSCFDLFFFSIFWELWVCICITIYILISTIWFWSRCYWFWFNFTCLSLLLLTRLIFSIRCISRCWFILSLFRLQPNLFKWLSFSIRFSDCFRFNCCLFNFFTCFFLCFFIGIIIIILRWLSFRYYWFFWLCSA